MSYLGLMLLLVPLVASAHDRFPDQVHKRATSLDEVAQYIAQFRSTGDDVWLQQSDDFFRHTASSALADTPRWQLLQAWHAQANHDFARALNHVDKLLSTGRADVSVWLLHANIARVMGQLDIAQGSCRRVLAQQLMLGQLCLAQVRMLLDGAQMHEHRVAQPVKSSEPELKEAEQKTVEALASQLDFWADRLEREQLAWAYGVVGTLALHTRDYSLAHRAAQRAFDVVPSVPHRVQLAQVLLAQKQSQRALELVTLHGQQPPALALLRLRALEQLGMLGQAEPLIDELHTTFTHDIAHGDYAHAREMAEFYFDFKPDYQLASKLALRNWRMQREHEDLALLRRARAL